MGWHQGADHRLRQTFKMFYVIAGKDRDHAGHGFGFTGVDTFDAGMGPIASDEHQFQRAWNFDIAEILAASGG